MISNIKVNISLWKINSKLWCIRSEWYLDGGGGVEHVLEAEVAAAAKVVFAEVLNELQVVQPVGQRHVLLQTDIWEGRGSHQV